MHGLAISGLGQGTGARWNVAEAHRRRGGARQLLEALIPRAQALEKQVMIAGIKANHAPPIGLREQLGFEASPSGGECLQDGFSRPHVRLRRG